MDMEMQSWKHRVRVVAITVGTMTILYSPMRVVRSLDVGGYYAGGSGAGSFCFSLMLGGVANYDYGFRVVLVAE